MNIVGPLANPAHAGRQVVGVGDAERAPLIAGALRALGSIHALVVHGEPGLDEISPLGPSHVLEIRGDDIREWTVHPERYGMSASAAQLAGGSPAANADTVLRVLEGAANPGATAAVLLNAAAALYVAGAAPTFDTAVDLARETHAAGAGMEALNRLRAAYTLR
jgi:anthranilate phosphoribosyltransferase